MSSFKSSTKNQSGIYMFNFIGWIFVGARILIFFGFNPKTIPELGKLRFSNSKVGKTD
jgi:hypothetical protein